MSSWLSQLSAGVRALFAAPTIETPRPVAGFADYGRAMALRALRSYLAEVTFYRAGGEGKAPVAFRVNKKDILLEWPDAEVDLALPSLVVVPGRGEHSNPSLTPWIREDTKDLYGAGTVVRALGTEYRETFTLEVWGAGRAERRAFQAAFDTGPVFNPHDDRAGLCLKVPGYYGETATFSAVSSTIIDTEDSVRNRRKANIEIELRFSEVHLVRYVRLRPRVTVETRDPGVAFDDDEEVEVEIVQGV